MRRFEDVVLNQNGMPVAGAHVSVFLPGTTTKAVLYSDDIGTMVPNPVVTSGLGVFSFFVASGKYDFQVSGGNISTYTQRNVQIDDIFEFQVTDTQPWQTQTLELSNQGSGPTPPLGTVNLYSKTDKNLYFKDDTGREVQVNGGGGGGGGTPAAPFNSLQKNALGVFGAANVVDNGTVLAVNEDTQFAGPNPYYDVRKFGVRNRTPNVAPVTPGIVASISAGSSTAILSSASLFANGDGVVVFKAGPTHSMTTPLAPTVTPSVASALTGTGVVVNSAVGGQTYNYQIIARDTGGGLTAASTVGNTNTGLALGSQSVGLVSCTRSFTTVTCTTSAPHTLPIGSFIPVTAPMVYLNETSEGSFSGWYKISSATDTTHFTFVSGFDTDSGAAASCTGGTVHWFNCNHLTWTAVPGAYQYFIYGRTGGQLTLLGVNKPQTPVTTDLTWDDFGSPMMDNFAAPYFVPSTPPVTPTADNLVTSIVSGGGTTSLVLASPASNSVSNSTILVNDGLALATATSQGAVAFIPAGLFMVVNAYTVLPARSMVSQAGQVLLNETLQLGSGSKWQGFLQMGGTDSTFAYENNPLIANNRAYPGFLYPGPTNNATIRNITFKGPSNNNMMVVADGISLSIFENLAFESGDTGDYMGMAFLIRSGPVVPGAFRNTFKNVSFVCGGASNNFGYSATPVFSAINHGEMGFENVSLSKRGMFFWPAPSGAKVSFKQELYVQGGLTPTITSYFASGGVGFSLWIDRDTLDTAASPLYANFAQNPGTSLTVAQFSPASGPATDVTTLPLVSGYPAFVVGGVQPTYTNSSTGTFFTNNPVRVNGALGSIGYAMGPAGPPGVVVTAGGSVPIGDHQYAIQFIDINGLFGPLTVAALATTTPGNQNVVITRPAAPIGAVAWTYYRDGAAGKVNGVTCAFQSTTVTSVNDTGAFGICGPSPRLATGAATSMGLNGLLTHRLTLWDSNATGFTSLVDFPSNLTAQRFLHVPDATGTFGLLEAPQTWTGIQTYGPVVFASLPASPNGSLVYCSDCSITSPCTGGGTGAFAKRLNGNWVCN